MRRLLCVGATVAAAMVGLNGVRAADVYGEPPVVYAPPPPVVSAPFAIWTGCYVGGNIGYASAKWDLTETAPLVSPALQGAKSDVGIALGGQIGCDYQVGPFVVGLQGMFDGTGLKSALSNAFPNVIGQQLPLSETWFTTLTGRVGYSIEPAALLYFKAGAAWTQQEGSGWTAGVGLEWKALPNLSVFVEYNYLGLGTKTLTFGTLPVITVSDTANVQLILVGFNYRFDLGPAVTTRYP